MRIDNAKQSTAVMSNTLCLVLFCLHLKCLLACDKVHKLTGENGTLLSQENLAGFMGATTCIWEIQVPAGYRIELTVRVFQIKTSCCACIEDYVEFRDGLNSTSPVVGRYCANSKPVRVYSSQNVLRVHYFSSARNLRANLTRVNKFRADYQTICGEFIGGGSGMISPPPYPKITRNHRCLFTIVAPYGWVKVTIANLTIGKSNKCHTDFLVVKETAFIELKSTTQRQPLCGQLTSVYIFSKGHELFLLYQASSPLKSNFTIKYEATNTSIAPCGGLFTGNAGYIYSYGYPKPYPKNAVCSWKIEVSHGYIKFKFLEFNFDTGTETGCMDGKVEVFDGWTDNSVKIRTYCNQLSKKTSLKSQSNRLLIKATSKNKEFGTFLLSYNLVEQGLCTADQFFCTSRQCVSQADVCDGKRDCLDGSDELNCPEKKNSKALYIVWILIVFVASVLMVIWLWKTWRKAVHRTVRIRRNHCSEEDDYACEVPSQSGAPPTYSEALNHTPTSLPSYEEALLNENAGVILEQGNTARFLARSDTSTRHLLLRQDSERTCSRLSNNTRQSELAVV